MKPQHWRSIAVAAVIALVLVLIWVSRPWQREFARIADPPGILREVRLIRELGTVRYSIQKVTGLTENKVPLGSESILLIVQARVYAGIDLQDLKDSDIQLHGNRQVDIKLPKSQILHVDFDEKNTRVWDRTKTWWTPWVPYDVDLEKKARIVALDAVKQEAIDMGILLEAQLHAQAAIRALLRPLGFERVTFRPTQS